MFRVQDRMVRREGRALWERMMPHIPQMCSKELFVVSFLTYWPPNFIGAAVKLTISWPAFLHIQLLFSLQGTEYVDSVSPSPIVEAAGEGWILSESIFKDTPWKGKNEHISWSEMKTNQLQHPATCQQMTPLHSTTLRCQHSNVLQCKSQLMLVTLWSLAEML